MIAKNIAPWLFRKFAFQNFSRYDQSITDQEIQSAKSKIIKDKQHKILWSDINPQMIQIAKENAIFAWVDKYIDWEVMDATNLLNTTIQSWTLLSNPPYWLRLKDNNLDKTYQTISDIFTQNPKLNWGIITSYEWFRTQSEHSSRKKTSLYNGWEKCFFYKRTIF
jgi:putative N6-adenine-specific DNA methylase